MTTLNDKIAAAKTLEEVCALLNSFERDENDDQDRLDHHVDICELPNFGKEPSDPSKMFSWNDTHCLIQNTCTGPAFEIVQRNDTNFLIEKLNKEMQEYFDGVITNKESVICKNTIDQCFDEILHNFMVSEFTYDYRDDELAMEFYTNHGCDIRVDFERESVEYIND